MDKVLAFSVKAEDCEWQYFRAGGKGGQKQNKTSSGARVIHHPSGARGESREERSQRQNRKLAWQRMVDSRRFRLYISQKLAEGPTPEELVARDMMPENLKVEYRENGKWVEAV